VLSEMVTGSAAPTQPDDEDDEDDDSDGARVVAVDGFSPKDAH